MNHPSTLLTALFCVALPAAPLAATDWNRAQWIGFTEDQRPIELAERAFLRTGPGETKAGKAARPAKPAPCRSFPSPLLRKGFKLAKPVRSAWVSVCGLGYYELYLNGKKVGDRVLDPTQTSYDKRAFYVTHDVTELLLQGGNAIGLMLGNGFYGQNIALGGSSLVYGEPRATLRLAIEYTDGAQGTMVTDESWKAAQGPVAFDNVYLGETFDARCEFPGWSSPGFDDSAWKPARKMGAPTAVLLEQQLEPMCKIRSLKPVAVLPAGNGEWILDMGQNMTGWLNIRVREASGCQIRMRFAELLMPDSKEIDTASTGVHVTGGDQMDIYVCKGGDVEEWEPRFTYHGFRYVRISGLSKKPGFADFTGWLVRTDAARIGTFECSDALINKFYNVSTWTIEDNLQGIISDCPHRERCAWMGDNAAVGEAASYNFDLRLFWPKVSADMETVLGANKPRKEGGLPYDPRAPCNIAVGKRLCNQARPDWGGGNGAGAVVQLALLRRSENGKNRMAHDAGLDGFFGGVCGEGWNHHRGLRRLVSAGIEFRNGHAGAADFHRALLPVAHRHEPHGDGVRQARRCRALRHAGRRDQTGFHQTLLRSKET
jgi:alpha-L-rhamnosidase